VQIVGYELNLMQCSNLNKLKVTLSKVGQLSLRYMYKLFTANITQHAFFKNLSTYAAVKVGTQLLTNYTNC
jgi:hypothetical protein